jgi:copper(I)-binding protein
VSARRGALFIGVVAIVAAGSCSVGGQPQISVGNVRVGATRSETAAAYMNLANTGDAGDALVAVSCDCAGRSSMHLTDTTDGLSMMVQVERIEVPASQTVAFEPGAAHVMLEDLEADLVTGSRLDLELEFASSGLQTVQARVVDLASLSEGVGVDG